MAAPTTISPQELAALREQNPNLPVVDVRTPAEYQEMHASFAQLKPLDSLKPEQLKAELGVGDDDTVYVFCRSGGRAKMACEKLQGAGHPHAVIVEGGMLAWEAAGLPVERGRAVMSLERQVRIAAGSLVFAGVVLGYFVHPGFFGLSGFVGAGLVFAGVTDTCAMGMLIAKMPWNQAGATCAANTNRQGVAS